MSQPDLSTPSESSNLGRRLIEFLLKSRDITLSLPKRLPGLELVSPTDLLLLATLSAVAGTAIIIVITAGVSEANDGVASLELGLAFVVLLLVFRFSQNLLLRK